MTFRDHFSGVAAGYAAHRPRYPAALVEYLASVAPRCEVAWDCGCGSGQLSVGLAGRFERVIATDASAEQEQIAAAEPHPRIEYRRAPAEASGIAAGSIDFAVAAQAAHWFDLKGYYAEVRRIARPRSIVAIISSGTPAIEGPVGQLVERSSSVTVTLSFRLPIVSSASSLGGSSGSRWCSERPGVPRQPSRSPRSRSNCSRERQRRRSAPSSGQQPHSATI